MAINNPFIKASIGSPVDLLGNFDEKSVLLEDAHITRSIERQSAEMTMRGQSDLVRTTAMNQASIGVAGSYGVEGVQKATSAVSAYFGYSAAELRKQVNVVYEIVQWGGWEYINFDGLNPMRKPFYPATPSEINDRCPSRRMPFRLACRDFVVAVAIAVAGAFPNAARAASCDTLSTKQQCCSKKDCGGKVLSNRDAHNCKDKSKGKSWHPASDGKTDAQCSDL